MKKFVLVFLLGLTLTTSFTACHQEEIKPTTVKVQVKTNNTPEPPDGEKEWETDR